MNRLQPCHCTVVVERIDKNKGIERRHNYDRKGLTIAGALPKIYYTFPAVLRPPNTQPALVSRLLYYKMFEDKLIVLLG